MATSLAEQLQRLATPQSRQLVDSKKRASILFDSKEAANKDRETIYDIGLSGLHELMVLNPIFAQFEHTLFDRTARDLVRSVESIDVNKNLDKQIKKFFIHLSPHFLLQPAHKCLEWLIRRFHINEYNINGFMMLILPYHETRIFVKCVQTMPLRDEKHTWHWLQVLQKPGITLSKQTLFNRAATDKFLLQFICKYVCDAVRELDTKAYMLQAMFGFYCTTVLGALDTAANITDWHISNIYPSLRKGLVSSVTDFCAASMMIMGQLVIKAKLSLKFLNVIISLLIGVTYSGLQSDAVILLSIIYQHQSETLNQISDETLSIIVTKKWIPTVLGTNYAEGVNILPFFLPLMASSLKNAQLKGNTWNACMSLCESLLMEVILKGDDAEPVIRYVLLSAFLFYVNLSI